MLFGALFKSLFFQYVITIQCQLHLYQLQKMSALIFLLYFLLQCCIFVYCFFSILIPTQLSSFQLLRKQQLSLFTLLKATVKSNRNFLLSPIKAISKRIKLRVITLQGAIEKSPILLSHYWKNGQLDSTIIYSYFRGIKIYFAHRISNKDWGNNSFYKGVKFIKNLREIQPLSKDMSQ